MVMLKVVITVTGMVMLTIVMNVTRTVMQKIAMTVTRKVMLKIDENNEDASTEECGNGDRKCKEEDKYGNGDNSEDKDRDPDDNDDDNNEKEEELLHLLSKWRQKTMMANRSTILVA